jgi:hypothetical protein
MLLQLSRLDITLQFMILETCHYNLFKSLKYVIVYPFYALKKNWTKLPLFSFFRVSPPAFVSNPMRLPSAGGSPDWASAPFDGGGARSTTAAPFNALCTRRIFGGHVTPQVSN